MNLCFSDMAAIRSDGGFIIKGRVADAMRLKIFAKVLYPAPIEEALGSHPTIQDLSLSFFVLARFISSCLLFTTSRIAPREYVDWSLPINIYEATQRGFIY